MTSVQRGKGNYNQPRVFGFITSDFIRRRGAKTPKSLVMKTIIIENWQGKLQSTTDILLTLLLVISVQRGKGNYNQPRFIVFITSDFRGRRGANYPKSLLIKTISVESGKDNYNQPRCTIEVITRDHTTSDGP